jgi:hypothetical protein
MAALAIMVAILAREFLGSRASMGERRAPEGSVILSTLSRPTLAARICYRKRSVN